MNPRLGLGLELTAILGLAMICSTALVLAGKMEIASLQPIFSAVIAGAFALALPSKVGNSKGKIDE